MGENWLEDYNKERAEKGLPKWTPYKEPQPTMTNIDQLAAVLEMTVLWTRADVKAGIIEYAELKDKTDRESVERKEDVRRSLDFHNGKLSALIDMINCIDEKKITYPLKKFHSRAFDELLEEQKILGLL